MFSQLLAVLKSFLQPQIVLSENHCGFTVNIPKLYYFHVGSSYVHVNLLQPMLRAYILFIHYLRYAVLATGRVVSWWI